MKSKMESLTERIVLCKLKTGGKTLDDIRVLHTADCLTNDDLLWIQKANNALDGLEVILVVFLDDNTDNQYHLLSWQSADDERVMRAYYYYEQLGLFGLQPKFNQFKAKWLANCYEPDGCITFYPEEVTEIREIGLR